MKYKNCLPYSFVFIYQEFVPQKDHYINSF